jgi:hypothetical protein
MYYNPNWFIPSIFLLSTLVPILKWFQHILKVYIFRMSIIKSTQQQMVDEAVGKKDPSYTVGGGVN